MNVRAVVATGLAAVAAALALVLVVPSSADARALGFPPPPGIGSAVAMTDLPSCSDVQADGAAAATTAYGLGWTGTWRVLVVNGANEYSHALAIPCRSTGRVAIYVATRKLAGSGNSFNPRGGWDQLEFTCSTASGVTHTENVAGNPTNALGYSPGAAQLSNGYTGVNTCPYLVKVTVTLYNVIGGGSAIAGVAVWKPSNWTTESSVWDPAAYVPENLELPIVCEIDNSGADVFEILQNVVASLADFPRCLFVPVGWDRAGRIADSWNNGAAGKLAAAFRSSVPGGLVCGTVATIPIWNGGTVVLDTCPVDVAGPVVKTVVGWVMVLGIAALIVRRIMWAVGSSA